MPLTPFHGPPAQPPAVPGYIARTLIGSGAHGEVWAAREQTSGDDIALKIGHRTGAEATGGHEADLLARFDHPHLVRLRRVVPMPDGGLAMVLDLAAGGSLAALVAARGRLDAGEVVTILVPLATVLAEMHAQGICHGDIAPGNVLFAGDGRPLLGDLGVGGVLGAPVQGLWRTPGFTDPALVAGTTSRAGRRIGHRPDPRTDLLAGDVWGLAAVAWFGLTGMPPAGTPGQEVTWPQDSVLPPPALLALLKDCLSARPQDRPDPAEIAARAWDATAARPVRLAPGPARAQRESAPETGPALGMVTLPSAATPVTGPARPPIPARPSIRSLRDGGTADLSRIDPARPSRRHLAAAVAGCVLSGVAAAVFFAAGSGSSPHSSPEKATLTASAQGSAPASARADPSAADTGSLQVVLEQIAGARAAAFQQVSTEPLRAADEPGSAAERMDTAVVERLHHSGVRLDGVTYQISRVAPISEQAGVMEVRAVVSISGHRQVSADGQERPVQASGPQRVRLRLISAPDRPSGWLVRSVEPAP